MGAHSRRVVCTPRGPGQVRGKREAWGGPGCDRPAPPAPPSLPADDAVTSSTSESSALSKKRFTLQSFAALKAQKGQGLRLQGPGRISHMARCRELQRYWVVTPGFSLGAPNSQGAERSSFWRRG